MALYLQARHTLQVRVLKIKFRHCIQERVWRGDGEADGELARGATATTSATTSTEAKVARGRKAHLLREVLSTRTAEDVPVSVPVGGSSRRSKRTALAALGGSAEVTAESKKVVPVGLPPLWHYAPDLVMPESPLVAFEGSPVSLRCISFLDSIRV